MTTNGKGSMGEPRLGVRTRKDVIDVPTSCIPSNGSVSDGEKKTLARQV